MQLLEEEGALQSHLGDGAIETLDAKASTVVVFFDIVDAAAQLDAFPVVGGLDRGGQVFV
jgi:hypothetical protein